MIKQDRILFIVIVEHTVLLLYKQRHAKLSALYNNSHYLFTMSTISVAIKWR